MAYLIKLKNGEYRVRWRGLDGVHRSRNAPTKKAADALKRDVETAIAVGTNWEPEAPPVRPPDLAEIAEKYLRNRAASWDPRTFRVRTYQLEVWLRFLEDWQEGADASHMSRTMLMDYLAWLQAETGRHGRTRELSTARRYLGTVELMWAWAEEWAEEHGWASVPRARRVSQDIRLAATTWRAAATWEDMQRCIAAAGGWLRDLMIVMYYTGLRVDQGLRLRRADLDLGRGVLHVRGELGKTTQEQEGRAVPMSAHFVAWARDLALVDGGWLVACDRLTRTPRPRDAEAAWERSGVRRDVWEGRPHHAFRAGYLSSLRRSGAELDAAEVLLGHAPTKTAKAYLDPEALPLRAAVDLIPRHDG